MKARPSRFCIVSSDVVMQHVVAAKNAPKYNAISGPQTVSHGVQLHGNDL